MSSSPSWQQGPRAKCDQVVFEAIAKAAEAIVGGRQLHTTHPTSTPNTRFHLQLAEHPDVRQILQRWRRALHVPLRIDVFHETESGKELLERWCLEYVPTSLQNFNLREPNVPANDPIVQLRHVCKRIVVWLRTLYASSRLLPCSQLLTIDLGVSIYVNEGEEHDLGQQGFLLHSPPSPVVTPYGELSWKAWYVDKSVVERLKPKRVVNFASQPIPIAAAPRSSSPHNDAYFAARSAPSHLRPSHNATTVHQRQPQNTYDPSKFHRRTASNMQGSQEEYTTPIRLERRHTTMEDKPERVMSGLSLALMNDEPERRAALHEPPPHKSTTGEYGYAYNSHIPWQKVHPSANTATDEAPLAASPHLATTPPIPFLLPPRTTPPFRPLEATADEVPVFDSLHVSPFHAAAASSSQSMLWTSDLRNNDDDDEEEMPFAMDRQPSMLQSLHKDREELSTLTSQLADFQAFGAALDAESVSSSTRISTAS